MSDASRPCAEWAERSLLSLFEELDPALDSELHRHLQDCPACRRHRQEVLRTLDRYRDAGLEEPADPHAWRRRIGSSAPASAAAGAHPGSTTAGVGRPPPRRSPWSTPLARAAMLLVAVVAAAGGWWLLGPATEPDDLAGRIHGQPLSPDGVALGAGVLRAPDPEPGDKFGAAMSAGAGWLAIGAPGSETTGTVYLLRAHEDGLRWATRLRPPGGIDREFGSILTARGDRLAVGGVDRMGTGRVALFSRVAAGWRLTSLLVDPTGDPASTFGSALALDGDLLLVGASRALPEGTRPDDLESGSVEPVGVVYVYRAGGSGWELAARLGPREPLPNSRFGYSIALDGDRALVGARGEDFVGPASRPGRAYVFRRRGRDDWRQEAILSGSTGEIDFFGSAVALEGRRAVVGATEEQVGGARSGAMYAYELAEGEWRLVERLLPPSTTGHWGLGRTLRLGDGLLLAHLGVGGDRASATHRRAHVYVADGGGWRLDRILEIGGQDPPGIPGTAPLPLGDIVLLGAPGTDRTPGAVWLRTTSRDGSGGGDRPGGEDRLGGAN